MTPSPLASSTPELSERPWAALVEADQLTLGDTLIASRIARLCGEPLDSSAALALVLAIRAVREGSTALEVHRAGDLAPVRDDEENATELTLRDVVELPEPEVWLEEIRRSALVTRGVLHVEFDYVYLDRYYGDECLIAERLLARDKTAPAFLDPTAATAALGDMTLNAAQRRTVDNVLARTTTVLTGGPGMGKTYTIAGVLAAVRACSGPAVRVALAAPTGKAAARMTEELRAQNVPVDEPATTLHRLLGSRPDTSQRFRHDRRNPLPHDLVVIDEASMLSLGLMARLMEALPETTRLLLVGDPDQLASVEAGSVLRDLVEGLGPQRGVVQLTDEFRLGSRRAELARAFRRGDADAVLAVLDGATTSTESSDEVRFIEADEPDLTTVPEAVQHARRLREIALAGDAASAESHLEDSRLLCAHRTGPFGTRRWNRLIEQALTETWPEVSHQEFYLGRPLLVTRNDYGLGLTNGDTGVVLRDDDRVMTTFRANGGRGEPLSPWRLADVETMHAMTVHKAQGSQAWHVTVIVPPLGSRLLSREMLYTAVTRARATLTVVGSREAVRAAVDAPATRSSGLARRLRAPAAAPG